MSKVEVIVNNCRGSQEQVRTYGPELIRETFDSELEALKIANVFRGPGLSVIVRPHYNDTSRSFHEFRSFHGEPFKRVEFQV